MAQVRARLRRVKPCGEWHTREHGGARRRGWRKVHLAVDDGEEDRERPRRGVSPTNLGVRAVEVASSDIGDAPMPPDLLGRIPLGEPIASVTIDGAHDGRSCRDAIAGRGADTIIPPRRDAKPWKNDGPGAQGRNEALRAIERLGRTIWRRWSGHHRRRRVETKMNCMKLPGQRRAAHDFDRQPAELQAHVAILNRFTALGIRVTQPVA